MRVTAPSPSTGEGRGEGDRPLPLSTIPLSPIHYPPCTTPTSDRPASRFPASRSAWGSGSSTPMRAPSASSGTPSTPASTSSTARTATVMGDDRVNLRGTAEQALGRALRTRRDEGRHHHQGDRRDGRRAQRPRRGPPPHHAGGRAVADPAADRPDRRVPAPRLGRLDAHRGDGPRARRPGHSGQGALLRLLQLRRVAGVQGAVDRRPARRPQLHLRPERVQPASTRPREGDVRADTRPGPRRDGVQSAQGRPAVWRLHAGPAAAARLALGPTARRGLLVRASAVGRAADRRAESR